VRISRGGLKFAFPNICGGLEMAPHVNKWSPPDGAQE